MTMECPDTPDELDIPRALHLPAIDMTPSCFTPLAAAGTCPDNLCEQAREANAARELEIRTLSEPFALLFDQVTDAPGAGRWVSIEAFEDGEPIRIRTLEAEVIEASGGYLRLTLTDDSDPEARYTESSPALFSPEGVVLQLRGGVIRWTSHAFNTGSFYRGCDPATGVSFDQRFTDDGVFDLYCWDTGGNPVDCTTIDLWPPES